MPNRPSLPLSTKLTVGTLLAVAIVAPLLIWTYASEKPRLWGFPFFFWYQLLWVLIASALTWTAYLLVEHGRRGGDDR